MVGCVTVYSTVLYFVQLTAYPPLLFFQNEKIIWRSFETSRRGAISGFVWHATCLDACWFSGWHTGLMFQMCEFSSRRGRNEPARNILGQNDYSYVLRPTKLFIPWSQISQWTGTLAEGQKSMWLRVGDYENPGCLGRLIMVYLH